MRACELVCVLLGEAPAWLSHLAEAQIAKRSLASLVETRGTSDAAEEDKPVALPYGQARLLRISQRRSVMICNTSKY